MTTAKQGAALLAAAVIALTGCFDPEDPNPADASGSGNDTEPAQTTGSAGTAGSDSPTNETSGSTSSGTGCTDACEPGPPTCEGNDAVTCERPPDRCAELRRTTCPMGCDAGECLQAGCGDGLVDPPEACDDANDVAGDGCSATCDVETGWTCDTAEPSVCAAPDLAVTVLGAVFSAGGLDVTYEVVNVGAAASGAYRVDLWDTRTGGLDNPPELGDVGTLTISDKPSLDAGSRERFTDTIPAPANGTHFTFAVADGLDELVEQDENNNVALGHAWTNAGTVVHTSFASTSVPSDLPDDPQPASATVLVSSAGATEPELFFSINVTHPSVAELAVRVTAPNGASRMLVSGPPRGMDLHSTSFRAGSGDIQTASAPFAGLFEFAGDWDEPPETDGLWTLEVADNNGGGAGRLNSFSVHILGVD